jgi:Tol biopolymer transport system component
MDWTIREAIGEQGRYVVTLCMAMLLGACGSGAEELPGRLMFSRFDEASHTFLSTQTARPDGTDVSEIPLPGPEGGGRWSRAGDLIAVMTVLDDGRIGTAIIEPDGTVDRILEIPDATLNLVCVVWSPDDSRLACEAWDETDPTRGGIYDVLSSDGSDLRRLTTAPPGMVDFPGDYSPDDTEFVFLRAAEEDAGQLMIVDVAGGEPRRLSPDLFEDEGRFSPDGSSVLTSAAGSIVILGLDGVVTERVTGGYLFGPDWSPDGEWIAFSRAADGPFADIYISRPDGGDQRQVTDTADNEITLDWGAGDS